MAKRRFRLRDRVESRAGARCEYCKAPQRACGYRFHLEHVIPSAEGGVDDFDNRALACAACNLAKSDKTEDVDPESGELTPLFNPRDDDWEEHFRWSDDRESIIAISPGGRATIVALKLNDEMRTDARKLWFDAGLLP